MLRRKFLAIAGGAALLQGCSPMALINSAVPSSTYQVTTGIRYGAGPRHVLDIYQPSKATVSAPVVVFFYGGNWNSGDRADYLFVGEALASKGYVAVVPDYRLYPQVRYPEFLNDSAHAVQWAFEHSAEWGGDPQRVFLMGHSAGAYNAAMLALNPAYLRAAGADASRVRGLIGLAGPYDFLPLIGDVTKAVFGYPDTARATQPIEYVSSSSPPALLLTAKNDDLVNPGNSLRLARRLQERRVSAQVIAYPNLGHRTLIGALAAPLRNWAPVLDDIATFINARIRS